MKINDIHLTKRHFDEKQLAFISKSLSQIYKDGIPIKEALILLEDVLTNKYYKDSIRNIINFINEGMSLSESFKTFNYLYPKLFTGLIFVAENTGKLYDILNLLGNYYEKISEIKSEIKMASIYPGFILLSIIFMIGVFMNKIIPSFYDIYESMGITPSYWYKVIYNFHVEFKEEYLVSLVTILCWGSLIIITLNYGFIANKKLLLKIKIVNNVMEYMLILILSIITSSGINILYGLECCEDSVSPPYINKKIKQIKNSITEGNTLSESLEQCDMLSNYSLAIIRVREETGSIQEGFQLLSCRLEKDIYKKIKSYLKSLSPILIIIMAIIISIFIFVFVLPLFKELQNGIR